MRFTTQMTTLAMALAFTSITYSISAKASYNCEINQCKGGGSVRNCWAKMQREARSKSKACGQIIIGSGVSSYAMAMALPRACIKSSAVIKIHRPYVAGYRAVGIGSHWHNFYFGRIKPSAVNYFRQRGGMQREGYENAANMIGVPARSTGLPICKSASF